MAVDSKKITGSVKLLLISGNHKFSKNIKFIMKGSIIKIQSIRDSFEENLLFFTKNSTITVKAIGITIKVVVKGVSVDSVLKDIFASI